MEDMKKQLGGLGALLAIGVAILVGWLLLRDSDPDTTDSSSETEVSKIEDNTSDDNSDDSSTTTNEDDGEDDSATSFNIVETAQATDSLSTLVSAVIEADLVDTLSGEGPFTVFAPTNAAFNDTLAELGITAEELLARDDLSDILTYHVVSGKVMAADLSDGMTVTTVQGGTLEVHIHDGAVELVDGNGNEAIVTTADVATSNGVVHIIDGVVLP